MPRIPQPPHCDPNHCTPGHCNPGKLPEKDNSVDTKLVILKTRLEKELLQKDLINNFESLGLKEITEDAYVYVDDNGTPKKIKLIDIAKQEKDIQWEDLSKDVQAKITKALNKQDKLVPGKNIKIEGNVISAQGDVYSVNGKKGDVKLTAKDIGSISRDEAISVATQVSEDVSRREATTIATEIAEDTVERRAEEIEEHSAVIAEEVSTRVIEEKSEEIVTPIVEREAKEFFQGIKVDGGLIVG